MSMPLSPLVQQALQRRALLGGDLGAGGRRCCSDREQDQEEHGEGPCGVREHRWISVVWR